MENINTPRYWDDVYEAEWDRGFVFDPQYKRDYGPIHDAILALIDDGARVLDLGCGAGVLCRKIRQRRPAARVTGVDFSPLVIARNQEADRDLGVEYLCLDLRTSLDDLTGEYDVISICEVIEHLDQPEVVIESAFRRLRNGGRLVLTCPHDGAIPDREHLREWGHDAIFHLLEPYGAAITFQHFPPPHHRWMLCHLSHAPQTVAAQRLRESLAQRAAELTDLEARLAKYGNDAETKDGLLHSLAETLREQEDQVRQMHERIRKFASDNEQKNQTIEVLKESLRQRAQEVVELRETLRARASDSAAANEQIAWLRNSLQCREEQATALASRLREENGDEPPLHLLRSRHRELERRLRESGAALARLERLTADQGARAAVSPGPADSP